MNGGDANGSFILLSADGDGRPRTVVEDNTVVKLDFGFVEVG